MKKIILYLIIALVTEGCQGLVIKKNIKDNYYLVAVDMDEQLAIAQPFSESMYNEIITATVFAVGYNDKYLIAKQHPFKFPDENKAITNYYIMPFVNPMYSKPKGIATTMGL